MKQILVTDRAQWRQWLSKNHDKELRGIWLVFHRKETGKPSLDYEAAVEEALCFGWIDSVVRKIDASRYCRKFTPRRDDSVWSETNLRRAEKVIGQGRMTPFGLAKVEAAKRSGNWPTKPRLRISLEVPAELSEALARNEKARAFFVGLAPSYRRYFIAWIATAKRPETRAKRLKASLALLANGRKLHPV